MKKTTAEKHLQRTLLFFALLVFVMSLYLDSFLVTEKLASEAVLVWEGPWSFWEGGTLLEPEIRLPYRIKGPLLGKSFSMRATIPQNLARHINTIAFDTSMTSVQATIEGEEVYAFLGPSKGWARPVYGGSFTHFIRLGEADLGKELSLTFHYSSNNAFAGNLMPILLGSKASLLLAKAEEWPSLFFGFSLLLLGFLTILFSLAIKTSEEKKSFFYFGWVLLLLGGWVFSQTPSKFLLIRNPALPMNASFAALYLLPYFLTKYIIHSYPVRPIINHFLRVSILFIILYCIGFYLQVTGTAQLTDLLLLSGLALVLYLLSLFGFLSFEYAKGNKVLASFIVALSCLLASILAEWILLFMNIILNSAVILHAGMALAAAILFMHSVRLVRQKTQVLSKEEVLLSLAYNDALTKVGSRTSYELELQRITNNQSSEPIGILMMDINDLKLINDRFGHTKGDMILKDFAQRLRQLLPHRSKIYRYGGDEFIAFIPQVSEEGIKALAYKVQTYFQSSQKTEYQVAVGYDRYVPKTKEKISKVVSRADQAMYRTKNKMKASEASILT